MNHQQNKIQVIFSLKQQLAVRIDDGIFGRKEEIEKSVWERKAVFLSCEFPHTCSFVPECSTQYFSLHSSIISYQINKRESKKDRTEGRKKYTLKCSSLISRGTLREKFCYLEREKDERKIRKERKYRA